jgi:hypothetical protein
MSDLPAGLLAFSALFAALFGIVAWGVWKSGEWEDDE